MKYSSDGKVMFNPETHQYFLGEKQLMGVTTYIGKHKNKFDSDVIAEKYAKKHKLNKIEVLERWRKEGEISIINGHACHTVIENYINTGKVELFGISEKEKVASKFIQDYFESGRLTPVEAESIVYNEYLASQVDCIVKNKNAEYFILDWKTNKKIETGSYGKFMLSPFDQIPDANFYHYSIQLSLYKSMCRDYKINKCFIVHLDNDSYNLITPSEIVLGGNIETN